MITLKKKKHTLYSIVAIAILLSLGFIFYNFLYTPRTLIIIGFLNTILFIWGIEVLRFRGRESNIAFLYWLSYLLLSTISLALIIVIINTFHLLFSIEQKEEVVNSIMFSIAYSIIFYFIFKFIQILFKRLQDFNQPGMYLISIIPIASWIVGIKIYKSGYKFLGILVFFNLSIALLYILLAPGNKGSNYFGINQKHVYKYKKEAKRIKKANSLNDLEKEDLINKLIQKYKEIEKIEKEKFIIKETTRLINKEKLKTDDELLITQNRKIFYRNLVNEQIEKYYLDINWC